MQNAEVYETIEPTPETTRLYEAIAVTVAGVEHEFPVSGEAKPWVGETYLLGLAMGMKLGITHHKAAEELLGIVYADGFTPADVSEITDEFLALALAP